MASAAELTAVIKGKDELSPLLAGMKSKLQGIGAGMQKAGMAATVAGGAILGGLGVAAKAAADFEGGMRKVNSMMGLGADEFQTMSDDVLALAKNMGVDAVAATDALYQAISAGVPKDNAVSFLEVATKAAIAGVTDTETAVDGLTTVMNAFKMGTDDAKAISDVMFATVKGGKTTFEELSASMSVAAPIAAALGVNFEDLMAGVATLTKQGVPTAAAMTQMRAAMIALAKPTAGMEELLEKMGYESGEAALQALGFQGTLNAMSAAADGNNTVLAKALGSVEALNAVMGMTGENAAMAATDMDAMAEAVTGAGAATEAFNEIEKGANRQFEKAQEGIKAMAIDIGGKLLPVLVPLIKQIGGVITKIAAWMTENPALTKTIVMVAAAVGAILAVAGPMLILLGTILPLLPAIGAAFMAMLGPVGLIIAAIAAAVAIGILIVKNWDKIKEGASAVWGAIGDIVRNAVNGIIGFINKMIDTMNKIPFVNIGKIGEMGGIGGSIQSKRGGGLIAGAAGQPVPIIAHGGERVLTAGQARGSGGGSVNVNVYAAGNIQAENDLAETIRQTIIRIGDRNNGSGIS